MSTETVAVEEEKTIAEFLAESEAKETESKAPVEDVKQEPSELSQEKEKDTPAKEDSQEKTTDTKDFEFKNADYYKDMDKDQLLEQIKRQEEKVHKAHKTITRKDLEVKSTEQKLEQLSKDKELLQKQASFSDEEYNELHDDSPAEANRRANEANNAKRELAEKDQREQELKLQEFIQNKVPNYSEYEPQINKMIKKDMDHFGQSPSHLGGLTYNWVQRAELEKSNTELHAQVKELNSKLEKQPKNILNQINEAAKTTSFGVDSGYSQSNINQKGLSGNYAEAQEAGIELIPD